VVPALAVTVKFAAAVELFATKDKPRIPPRSGPAQVILGTVKVSGVTQTLLADSTCGETHTGALFTHTLFCNVWVAEQVGTVATQKPLDTVWPVPQVSVGFTQTLFSSTWPAVQSGTGTTHEPFSTT
jgi:hypothetical protein